MAERDKISGIDLLLQIEAENERMRHALGIAARTFRNYEEACRLKRTPEADDKAARNGRLAEICERALKGGAA